MNPTAHRLVWRATLSFLAAAVLGWPPPVDARQWPLEPTPAVVRAFEPPHHDYGRGHRGVDLAGRLGQPVLAAADGTISFAGSIGAKPVVVVDHGTLRTTYEPVINAVPRGEPVRAGEVIGFLQGVAGHCFPNACLHWGVRRNQEYLDPLAWLGTERIRLLPLWQGPPHPLASPKAPPLDGWVATRVR